MYPCVLSSLSKKVILFYSFHHEAFPFKKIYLLLRTSLEPPPLKLITTSGYKLRPSFDGQAYDNKLSTAGRNSKLS
jgi:hypothetical protein